MLLYSTQHLSIWLKVSSVLKVFCVRWRPVRYTDVTAKNYSDKEKSSLERHNIYSFENYISLYILNRVKPGNITLKYQYIIP